MTLSSTLPVPLALAALHLAPASVVEHVSSLVLRRMLRRYPRLFKNLAQLDPADILLVPTDAPVSFLLRMGCDPVTFSVVQGDDYPAKACVRGRLEILVDLLEGRIDGDTAFFSRDLQVSGDTSVIVALRNTLDREEINLFDEVTGVCGPFAIPAQRALTLVDRVARMARSKISSLHDSFHQQGGQA